jgi:hypothetical protein
MRLHNVVHHHELRLRYPAVASPSARPNVRMASPPGVRTLSLSLRSARDTPGSNRDLPVQSTTGWIMSRCRSMSSSPISAWAGLELVGLQLRYESCRDALVLMKEPAEDISPSRSQPATPSAEGEGSGGLRSCSGTAWPGCCARRTYAGHVADGACRRSVSIPEQDVPVLQLLRDRQVPNLLSDPSESRARSSFRRCGLASWRPR